MLPLQWVTVIKFMEKYKNSWLRVSSFSFSGFFGLRSSIFVFYVFPESSHFTLPASARLNRKPVSGKTTHSRQIRQLCKSNRQNDLNSPPETYLCSTIDMSNFRLNIWIPSKRDRTRENAFSFSHKLKIITSQKVASRYPFFASKMRFLTQSVDFWGVFMRAHCWSMGLPVVSQPTLRH